MKHKKILASTLAALMTVTSVGVTAFAEDDTTVAPEQVQSNVAQGINVMADPETDEENGISPLNENLLDNVTLNEVRVNSNRENTAKGFSCTFDLATMPILTTTWKFELKCGNKLLSTTTVKGDSDHLNNQIGTVFICWTGDNGASGTWSTVMNEENVTTADKPNKLVMYVGDESKEFTFTLGEASNDTFNSLSNVEDPEAVNNITIGDAITSTNRARTIEGFSITFRNIKTSKSLEINLCHDDTVLSTTKMKETSEYFNQQMDEISCLIGWGGAVSSNDHWSTDINVDNIRSIGKNTLPNKIIVKQAGNTKEFALNLVNAVADAYEDLAIFRDPQLGTVEWVPNDEGSQCVCISIGNIGRVHDDMKVELMHDSTVLATTTAKNKIRGLETENITSKVVCAGNFTGLSSSWSSELNVNNWARIKPNKVRITNNGVTTTHSITAEQGNYDGLNAANKKLTLVEVEPDTDMTDTELPGKSAEALYLALENVGYVGESMIVELYHNDTLLSKTNVKDKQLRQIHDSLGVTVIVDGDPEVSGSWETTDVYRSKWSLDTAPNKVKITIDGEIQWLDIDEISYYSIFTQFSVFGRSINVSAYGANSATTVYADDAVTVDVTLKGNNISAAQYELSYDNTKFELTSSLGDTDYSSTNGTTTTIKSMNANGQLLGELLHSYTFKALAQTAEVTSAFTLSNVKASTTLEAVDSTIAATTNGSAEITIALKEYETSLIFDGTQITDEELTAASKNIAYDGAEHTFIVNTNPNANVKYKVNGTETNEVKLTAEGTYTVEYTVENPALGYDAVTGSFTIVIGAPLYEVEVDFTEDGDYIAANTADNTNAKKIVLVYTNTDGLSFKYDDKPMIDVTAQGYKYNGTEYEHVYAFVTDYVDNSLETYKNKVTHSTTGTSIALDTNEQYDINLRDGLEINDISAEYGVYNGYNMYFTDVKYQKYILKADTNKNKKVDNGDITDVTNAVRRAEGFTVEANN